MDAILEEVELPHDDFETSWGAIKVANEVRERLVARSLLALTLRSHFPFDRVPVHGLVLLSGPPGTGKTTLARGLANEVAKAVGGAHFVSVDPHALTGASLGRSQREVAKLFRDVIPERAAVAPCIVLLDEVESLAADRKRLSLEANPIDVHRATDATLAGLDSLSRGRHRVLCLATTNVPDAVDGALISRADWSEEIGLPDDDAREEIIADTLDVLATQWSAVATRKDLMPQYVAASRGMDGRQLRKAVLLAAAERIDTAQDPSKLTSEQLLRALRQGAMSARAVAA